MYKQKIIIVGNGPVAHKFLETLVDSGNVAQFNITVFGEEPRPAYGRVKLTAWFETRQADSLAMATSAFYRQHGIRCYTSEKITSINRQEKTVRSANGVILPYDTLVLGQVPTRLYHRLKVTTAGTRLSTAPLKTLKPSPPLRPPPG